MTITEFLTARLDEDEAVAREVARQREEMFDGADPTAPHHHLAANHDGIHWSPDVSMGHDRVLAEVEAKRRIVEYHYSWSLEVERNPGPILQAKMIGAEAVLRALAMPYADHPDYRDEWRP